MTATLTKLGREECLHLLAATNFGRVAVNMPGWPPVIRPVTYTFDTGSQTIVFRSARGSKFTGLVRSGEAAFEIDGIDATTETGWSVIVTGPAEEITNSAEIHRFERLELRPWAPGDKPHWIRIRTPVIAGRRIAPS
jgi:uncharacterized protein